MANIVEIPTDPELATYTQRVSLDGREYILTVDYSARTDCYYLSLVTTDGVEIMRMQKVLANWPLNRLVQYKPECPRGVLNAITFSSDKSPPGYGELGIGLRCTLYFVPEALVPPVTVEALKAQL